MVDAAPSNVTLEGPEPRLDEWPAVEKPTPKSERITYPGDGSELFDGSKKQRFSMGKGV